MGRAGRVPSRRVCEDDLPEEDNRAVSTDRNRKTKAKDSQTVKAKIFEVVLHKLPSGKSPASALEEQLNEFLGQHPSLQLAATHVSTLVSPAEPNAMPRSEESSIVKFCTLFYTEEMAKETWKPAPR